MHNSQRKGSSIRYLRKVFTVGVCHIQPVIQDDVEFAVDSIDLQGEHVLAAVSLFCSCRNSDLCDLGDPLHLGIAFHSRFVGCDFAEKLFDRRDSF